MAHIRDKVSADGKATYEVRYRIGGGYERSKTFRTKKEAKAFKVEVEASRYRGGFVDPRAGSITVAKFATEWLNSMFDLGEGTRDFYEMQLRVHIIPRIGHFRLNELSPRDVSLWYQALKVERGKSVAPKAYVRLKAMMNRAVALELISSSPCTIQGGGVEDNAESIAITAEEVFRLASVIKPRYRVAVLLKTFGALRTGELFGLQRSDIDLEGRILRVERQIKEPRGGGFSFTAPKAKKKQKNSKSKRRICLPNFLMEELAQHLEEFSQTGADGLVFPGDKGGPTRRGVWEGQFGKAKIAAGILDVTPHGLRHSGLSLAGAAGSSVAELKEFGGHSSDRAAMMYQHRFEDSGSKVADRLDSIAREAQDQKEEDSE